jgi:hypothetical protein
MIAVDSVLEKKVKEKNSWYDKFLKDKVGSDMYSSRAT